MKNWLEEIHSRSLWQILGIYGATSWIVLQIVDQLTETAGLPDWVPPFALVLLLLGLPVVMATAFLQKGFGGSEAAEGPGRGPDLDPESNAPRSTPAGAAEAVSSSDARRLFTWRNALAGGALAFVFLAAVTVAFMTMRNSGIGPVGSLVAKGLLEERAPVLVVDFKSSDEGLGHAATEAFRIDLSQSPVVRLVEPSVVAGARERMQLDPSAPLSVETAREIGIREGIPAVITGEVTDVGAGWVLTARVLDSKSGAVLASHREAAADSTEIIPSIDRLSGKIREKIGESYTSMRASPPLEQVTTTSLEALELYSQALQSLDVEGGEENGIRLLEEALDEDPEFASAWRKLGITLRNLRRERSRSVAAMERAYNLRDQLTPRERYLAESSYYVDVTGDLQRAIGAYERMLDMDPDDSWALNNMGGVYWQLGESERAYELMAHAVRADTMSRVSGGNLGLYLMRLGRFDEADSAFAEAARRFPDDLAVLAKRTLLEMVRGDHEAVRATADEMHARGSGSRTWMAFATRRAGESYAAQGRLREAAGDFKAFQEDLRESGDPGAAYEIEEPFWIAVRTRGDIQAGTELLDRALRDEPLESLDPLDRPYADLARWSAAAGRLDDARAYLAAHESEVPAKYRRVSEEAVLAAEGQIAFEQGRYDEAIRLFRESRDVHRGCGVCLLDVMAEAWDRAGMPDSAIATLELYLATATPDRARHDASSLGPAHETLGRLYEQRGDLEDAALHYAAFAELWDEADPELQPRVEAVRARLEEIVRERG